METRVTLPTEIPSNETIVLPISMHQPLERGENLHAILTALKHHGYQQQTTVLVCDFLNRHNCETVEEAMQQGEDFLTEHQEMLEGFKILRWADFLNSRNEAFHNALKDIIAKSEEGSRFYNKMRKTWEKCLSANYSLEASILYQQEEYAAVMCMDEFDHLIYPKRITNGMAYLYQHFAVLKPSYHHVKIAEKKVTKSQDVESNQSSGKERRHIHVAFRAVLEHVEFLLRSEELSEKAKRRFAEEMENTLMTHGLLADDVSSMFSEVMQDISSKVLN